MGGNHNKHVVYSNSYASNQWQAVVLTYDDRTWRLYVNGKLEDEAQNAFPITRSESGLAFGRKGESDNNMDFFTGGIDEVRIYDRVLSKNEIIQYSHR